MQFYFIQNLWLCGTAIFECKYKFLFYIVFAKLSERKYKILFYIVYAEFSGRAYHQLTQS